MRTASKLLCNILIIIIIIQVFAIRVQAVDNQKYSTAVPCKYNGTAFPFKGLAVVENDKKFGLIDKTGKVIVPFQYEQIFSNSSDGSVIKNNYFITVQKGKWGVLDIEGKLVLPCKYDSIWGINNELAVVGIGKSRPPGGGLIDGLWGLIDLRTGKEILPVNYNGITYSNDSQLYDVYLNGKWGAVNKLGKFIVPIGKYDLVRSFNKGVAVVQKYGKYGAIDKTGNVAIPIIYDLIGGFSNGVAIAKKGKFFGAISSSGKVIVPINYGMGEVKENGISYMRNNNKSIIFNSSGKVIDSSSNYDGVCAVTGNLIYVWRGNRLGAIDINGKEKLPFIYTDVRDTKNGIAMVSVNDKFAVIDGSGKVIVPLGKYTNINLRDDGYILVVSNDSKNGLIDCKGNTFLECAFYNIGTIQEGYFVANNDKGCMIFDKAGNTIVPPGAFDFIDYRISEQMAAVSKNGLVGYIKLH